MKYDEAVGRVLRACREAHEMRQEEVAAATGVTQSTYSRIECGKVAITVEHLFRVARALDYKPSDVIADAELLLASRRKR